MNVAEQVHIAEFRAELADELLPMWRASFEESVGLTDPHPLEEQRAYLQREVVPHNAVRVACQREIAVDQHTKETHHDGQDLFR